MHTKSELREIIRKKKLEYSQEEKQLKSREIFRQLEVLEIFQNANRIAAYWSLNDEVFTHDFLAKWRKSKKFFLPRVAGKNLEFVCFEGAETLRVSGAFGVAEPVSSHVNPDDLDLVLVPGVAFDNSYNRLGRGGGFYDRFLLSTKAMRIGVCFDFQFYNEIPFEDNDLKMDLVLYA